MRDNNYLPETYSATETGRVTANAAKALLGKVYLTFHKWNEAKNVLSQLIGKYSLLPSIGQVFDVNNKNNAEIIFAVHFNKDIVNEGHTYWYDITNLTDESGQADALVNCFTPGDTRKEMITYVKAESKTYLMTKFLDTKNVSFNQVGNDQILLRYADVVLMYAEALNELGYDASENSIALKQLNATRTRAGLTELTAADVPTQESFRKAILDERQKEFPYEGHRWFDLVRMGYAKSVLAAQGLNIQDYQLLFPIPQTEIEKVGNPDILWQNPGYGK